MTVGVRYVNIMLKFYKKKCFLSGMTKYSYPYEQYH